MCMVFLRRRSSMDASLYCAGKDSDMSQWSRNGPAHIHTNMEIYIEFIYIYDRLHYITILYDIL